MAARHKEGYYCKKAFIHVLVCKGLTIDDVGVSRDTAFQKIRPGAVFESSDFVKEKLGGLPQNDSLKCDESGRITL